MGTKFSAPPLGLARSRTPASQLWLLLIILLFGTWMEGHHFNVELIFAQVLTLASAQHMATVQY